MKAVIRRTQLEDSAAAGAALGSQLRDALQGERPDAVIVFASPKYDFAELLSALSAASEARALVGSSSAGEFTSDEAGENSACAIALVEPEMAFRAVVACELAADPERAARTLTDGLGGIANPRFRYRTAFVMADALAGHMEELVAHLTAFTGGSYRFFGGGAGGDGAFKRRFVFSGTEALPDAVVALEILSNKPIGIGVGHGWTPAGDAMRVTEANGTRIASLNAIGATEVFTEHASATKQVFDTNEPLPFFLHNVLGIDSGGKYKLRIPLSASEDGAVSCATEVPEGASVCIMSVSVSAAAEAAAACTRDAVAQLGEHKPAAALFFDCVATRLRMGKDFGFELRAVQDALGDAKMVGCNSIGQIARADGQLSGFHNCTAVVCVFPE